MFVLVPPVWQLGRNEVEGREAGLTRSSRGVFVFFGFRFSRSCHACYIPCDTGEEGNF